MTDPSADGFVDHVPDPARASDLPPAWTPPSATRRSDAAPAGPISTTRSWEAGVALGGVAPPPASHAESSPRRDLLLTAILLVAALAAGASSLLAWRDVGPFANGSETGWRQFDGSLGRGWVAVLGGVLLAVAGVLVAAERARSGRILAVLTGTALMVFSVLEWGLGLRNVRSGPGSGLWVLFVVGLLVVVAVGSLAPQTSLPDDDTG